MSDIEQVNSMEEWQIKENELKDALFSLKNIFDEFNIKFILRWGTCLGAVRDGRLLPWDSDLDLLLPIGNCHDCNDDNRLLFYSAFKEATEVIGLRSDSARRWKTIKDWNKCWDSRMNHIYNVPIVFWFKNTHVELYLGTNTHKVANYFGKLPTVNIYGHEFYVPLHTEKYLEDLYGESWKDVYCNFQQWKKYKDDIMAGKVPKEVMMFKESIEGWKCGQD